VKDIFFIPATGFRFGRRAVAVMALGRIAIPN
jgi:hypothetical protein